MPLMVPLTVPVTDKVPLEEADCDTLALGVSVPDTEEQPELVMEGEPVREPDALPDTVCVPVMELDTDCDGLIEGLEVDEIDPLELNETVLDTVEQSVGDCEPDAVDD